MESPKIGQKVVLKVDYWYDGGMVAKGETGVVKKAEIGEGDTEPTIWVKLDKPNADVGDNSILFYPQCGPQTAADGRTYKDTLDWFYSECELVD